MKHAFLKNTVILTLTSQILRLIGIFFIAFLSGRIGTEGVGLYQLICSVYFLIMTLSTSGIRIAVTRLIAESSGKSGGKTASNVLGRCIVLGLILSAAVGVLLYFSAGFVGSVLLGDARTVLSLKVIAPSLPFMAVTSCLQGYFYGVRKVFKPSSQMLFEVTVQLVIIMAIIDYFVPMGLEYACFAILLASTLTEVLSCAYSFILYKTEKRKLAIVKDPQIGRKIAGIFLPVAASANLRSGLRTAENVLIPSGLRQSGLSNKEALSQYGVLMGMVMPVLLFPSSFLGALSTLLIPEISEAHVLEKRIQVQRTVSRVLQFTLMLSFIICGIFIFFAKDLGMAIYRSEEAGNLLMLMSPLLPLIYLDFLVDAILNGLNEQKRTLLINLIDYSIRISLILVFVPQFGMMAFIVIFYMSTILNAYLSISHLLKVSGIELKLLGWIIKPLLCVMAAGLLTTLFFTVFPGSFFPEAVVLILKIALMALCCVALMLLTRTVTRQEVQWFRSFLRSDTPRRKNGRKDIVEHERG